MVTPATTLRVSAHSQSLAERHDRCMFIFRRRNRRTLVTEIAVLAAVCLFFVAGVFVESRRSANRAPISSSETSAAATSSSTAVADTTPTVTAAATAEPTPAETSEQAIVQTETPVVPAGTPNPGAVGQVVFIDLQGIENESVIEDSSVTISGLTTPDALLSINGQPVAVDLDGSFTADLQLDPGPNFVEIVSSNLRGEETSRVLSVVSVQ